VREQRRERPASESATTRRTFCADAAVCTHRKDQDHRDGMLMFNQGRRSLHVQKHTCANCGYPSASVRKCTSHASLFQPTDT